MVRTRVEKGEEEQVCFKHFSSLLLRPLLCRRVDPELCKWSFGSPEFGHSETKFSPNSLVCFVILTPENHVQNDCALKTLQLGMPFENTGLAPFSKILIISV